MPEKTLKEKVEIGTKYNRWTVKGFAYRKKYENFWHCECECGTKRIVRESGLKSGHSRSCGCYQRDTAQKTSRKHGHAREGAASATYIAWSRMIDRCTNPAHSSFPNYGGRGIRVCNRWLGKHGFKNFLIDMEEKSEGQTLDRYPDTNGNYEPGNCRWATMKEQQNNRRNNVRVWDGELSLTVQEAAEKYGVDYKALWYQVASRKLSLKDALVKIRTPKQQGVIEFEGKTLTRSEAARRAGMTYDRFTYLHCVKKLSMTDIVSMKPKEAPDGE